MSDMAAKIQTLWPEIVVTFVAFAVILIGLSPVAALRRATYPISMAGLVIAAFLAAASPAMGLDQPGMALYMKIAIAVVGLGLLAVAAELPTEIGEDGEGEGKAFDPSSTSRGEFFGFFLLSLVGAMLCAGADDLIWLFLALELTSLPTYVLVSVSRRNLRAPEAGVKYFFLGALSAGIFLYGFALIYGATGTTMLPEISRAFAEQGLSPLALTGLLLAIVGICFKIAAVPMHFYAADVYQGAATPVTTMLAFVPKAAGFVALILLLATVGWPLGDQSELLVTVLWVLAVATMFIGNTVALLQSNVKRVLAYSSVAHSGYMMVGLIAGPVAAGGDGLLIRNGLAAVLFYLVAYGVMNLGAFAVLGLLKRSGEEAETFEDLRGLAKRHPGLAAVMAICVLSLTGLPPLVGFWGKLFLISSAISAGFYVLAALLVISSAIAAYYYLGIIVTCYLTEPTGRTEVAPLPQRAGAAIASAAGVIVLSLAAAPLVQATHSVGSGIPLNSAPSTELAEPQESETDPAEPRAEKDAADPATDPSLVARPGDSPQ